MIKIDAKSFVKFAKGHCYRRFASRMEMENYLWIVSDMLEFFGADDKTVSQITELIYEVDAIPSGTLVREMHNDSIWKGGQF